MPDLAEAAIPTRGTRLDPAVRFDFRIAGGLVVALVAVAAVNGTTRSGRPAPHDATAPVAAGSAAYVSATMPAIVQEARLEAPPLIDVSPAATPPAAATRRVAGTAPSPARGPARGPAEIPMVVALPSHETVGGDGAEVSAPPASRPSPPVSDRWQPLRSALAQCGSANGAIWRAMCEQEARLAHCDGFWGLAALCPTARSEYGQ